MRRHHVLRLAASLLAVSCVLTWSGCASVPVYSEAAYRETTELKVDALAVMDKATEPYASHEKEVAALTLRVEKAYEYARGRPNNELSTRQWAILKDPTRNLLGGFLHRWREKGTLGQSFVTEMKGAVGSAFDAISGLESGKLKPHDVTSEGASDGHD